MKKAIGIGIALCIMMSLAVVLAGAGEGDKAKDVRVVVQWKGAGTNVTDEGLPDHLAELVDLAPECEKPILIFKVDMLDPTTGRSIGTGYDYITNLSINSTTGSGVATTCYIFDFSRSGHGHGVIISKNDLTLQPALEGNCGSLTHILGSFPDENNIQCGTGKFKNVEGRVRASGGVNLTSAEFDHLFVITLDKGKSK